MLRLTKQQLNTKVKQIHDYMSASNAANGSKFDANANVSHKNIATLESEINKDINIQINRHLMAEKLTLLFGEDLATEYIRQLEAHEIYTHDESSLKPYCASISLYPFLLDGLANLGGESKAPKHLDSFCGSFINLVFAASSQFAGALATVEFLMYFDHFARLDFGDSYLTEHKETISQYLQQIVYTINQPAAARGYQSVFWNVSCYDKFYFDSLFGTFVFPDGDEPKWDSVCQLQEFFLSWFSKERERAILTFPVVTCAMLVKDGQPLDADFEDMLATQMSQGNSFFIYQSTSADSLASCCRLRNEVSDNTFSFSLGAGGVSTGSINVITINMNRLIQDKRDLGEQVRKIHKYHVAYRHIIEDFKNAGMLTVYDAGFISLGKQYLTIGINGMVEGAESQGIQASNTKEYKEFVASHLKTIFDLNKEAKTQFGYMFNTEFVPAENLGVKNADWDKKDGYIVPRDCYNSYFYAVEDSSINSLDKFVLHGEEIIQFLDGGSALHLNLDDVLTKEAFKKLIKVGAKTGCNYWCTNVKTTICNTCNHIDKRTVHKCEKCGSVDVDWATRIIGYLKRVSAWTSSRQKEHALRHYHRQ